jgi:hypothetical protein
MEWTNEKPACSYHQNRPLICARARARYGADGWNCTEAKLSANEEPVGGVFIEEHCEKVTATRHLIVDRQLYRSAGKPLQDFIGASTLLIFRRNERQTY